ncbi:hypothetical protein QUA40_02240 [Microcoleus sp. Pol11C3]|uniref:hypothetical protein n=1 Tax=Microcoleus sp. Pol11C3 TaxID=3055390 RepID=UPI002FD602D7
MIQFVRQEMHDEKLAFSPQARTLAATPVSDEAGFSLTAKRDEPSPLGEPRIQTVLVDN